MKLLLKSLKSHFIFKIFVALFYVGIACAVAVGFKFLLREVEIYETVIGRFLFTLSWVGLIFLAYSLYVKRIEKRELTEYVSANLFKELSIGIGLGAALIVLQVVILRLLGVYTINSYAFTKGIFSILFISIITGFTEELINKGIIFRILESKFGSLIALIVVAIEVGITHISNSGATTISTLAVSLEFGIMLVLLYMITRRLWMVTGFHFAWNFTMGGVFGINVSGLETQGLFVSELGGPEYLTGGTFGIEAGVVAIALSLIVTTLLAIYIVKRKMYKNFR